MNQMTRDWVAKRIKDVGKKKIDLARDLDVSPNRITDIIKDERTVKTDELARFADFLEISISDAVHSLANNKLTIKQEAPPLTHEALMETVTTGGLIVLDEGLAEKEVIARLITKLYVTLGDRETTPEIEEVVDMMKTILAVSGDEGN